MRLGIVTASVSRSAGGVFDAVRSMGLALDGLRTIQIKVFGLADRYSAEDLVGWSPLAADAFKILGPRSWGYAPDLAPALDAGQLDVLHVHGLWMYPSVAGMRWSRRRDGPRLVSPHGMLDPWALNHVRWKKRAAAWLYENAHLRGADCIHALCEAEVRAFRAYGLKNPICVIPNGVHLPSTMRRPVPAWRETLGTDAKVLLYLGRWHRKKGLPQLLQGWKLARSRAGNGADAWHLAIAGWSENSHGAELAGLRRELAVESTVHLVGPQFGPDKDASYAAADAFILPSLSEGLPMVVLEAWSFGLPVLVTPECNLPEGFATGAALPIACNAEGIARGLEALFMLSETERWNIGRRGRELVEQRFSWPRLAAEMRAVYEWVWSGGEPPASVVRH